jgi:hypothetical protein
MFVGVESVGFIPLAMGLFLGTGLFLAMCVLSGRRRGEKKTNRDDRSSD